MDLPVVKQDKDFWRSHVEAAANFPGSLAAYCRQNNLDSNRFNYHRNKILKKNKFVEVRPVENIVSEAMPKETASYPQRMPDPKWLAALILELSK